MLVHSRTMAPDLGVAADEFPRPVHHVLSRKLDVELVLVVQDDAGELPAVFGSRDRCVERSAREGEVLLGEGSPRNGEDAGPVSRAGSRASTAATCMSDEVATGTPQARANSA